MRNKLNFLALILLIVFCSTLHAQAAGVKKFPGENATVSWTFALTDEAKITGFRIYAAATSAGSYSFTGTTALPAARQVVFPVSFSTNSVLVFYQVKAFYTAGATTVESDAVPLAGVEVDMNVPIPVGVQVK